MSRENPTDVLFFVTDANAIASDLYSEAFNSVRDPRSCEYKNGFRSGAFNRLISDPKYRLSAPYPVGSCQLDAWYAGYEEGKSAATLFQIKYLEDVESSFQHIFA